MVSDLGFSVDEDAILTQTLSGSDAEMSTLTYIVDTMPSNGILNVTSTGHFTYTPAPNYNGSDSFTYHVNDGMFDSSGATVSITVNSVNDLPNVMNESYTIAGNSFASSGNVYSNVLTGSDLEDLVLSFSAVTLPTHGILNLDSSGSYTYTPAYGYTGSDSFSYIAIDTSL
jgi:VCBS repeat-containing protein